MKKPMIKKPVIKPAGVAPVGVSPVKPVVKPMVKPMVKPVAKPVAKPVVPQEEITEEVVAQEEIVEINEVVEAPEEVTAEEVVEEQIEETVEEEETPQPVTPKPAVKPMVKPMVKPAVKQPATTPKPAAKPAVAKATPPKASKPAAAPKKATPASKPKFMIGSGKKQNNANFEVNIGGRTTREALIHLYYNKMKEEGLEFPSKKAAGEAITILEELLIEITDVSRIKFMNEMFKLIDYKPRAYSIEAAEFDTLVPAHSKSTFSRYVGDVPMIKGSYDKEAGTFTPGIFQDIVGEDGKPAQELIEWGEPMYLNPEDEPQGE